MNFLSRGFYKIYLDAIKALQVLNQLSLANSVPVWILHGFANIMPAANSWLSK
tara:strand:- start:224 stop:382 length:159 start_codon:yes stop_codon:yes gene_type:complete